MCVLGELVGVDLVVSLLRMVWSCFFERLCSVMKVLIWVLLLGIGVMLFYLLLM